MHKGITGKNSIPTNTVRFESLYTILIRQREEGHRPLRGEEMIFREDEWPLEEQMGGVMVCDRVCLGVMWMSSLLSCNVSFFLGWWDSQGGDLLNSWVAFGGPVFRHIKGVQRRLSLHLLFFKCLQLNLINIPKRHIWGCHVLNSFHS